MENWRRFLKEGEEGDLFSQVQQIIRDNKFLSHLADKITPESIKDIGNYYYVQFPGELDSDHIKKHFDESDPGSTWGISPEQVSGLILDIISKPPTKEVEERGALKFKWLNVPTGEDIGFDSVVRKDPNDPGIEDSVDLEPFGMVDRVKDWAVVAGVAKENDYDLVTQDREEYTEEDLKNNKPAFIKQELKVVSGSKMDNPTDVANVVTAKIGDVGGKPILSLMAVYPGLTPMDNAGNDLSNKKEFQKYGYYFLK